MARMQRVRLIHSKAAEAAERAALLRSAGYRVEHEPFDPAAFKRWKRDPPDAFVVDLERMPSHGRDVALALREARPTRRIPLVFAGGEPDKVARVEKTLPDATYAGWRGIRGALKRALADPPESPVVPGNVLAGYSGTPLPKKLGVKAGMRVALAGAPADFEKTLGALPAGTRVSRRVSANADLILWFVRSAKELRAKIGRMAGRVGAGDGLWIAWPKKSSSLASDVTQDLVRKSGLARGLVDYKICAIDETWSGLKFARRKPPRDPGRARAR